MTVSMRRMSAGQVGRQRRRALDRDRLQCGDGAMESSLIAASASLPVEDRLHVAVAAYLARYKELSRKPAATDHVPSCRGATHRALHPPVQALQTTSSRDLRL